MNFSMDGLMDLPGFRELKPGNQRHLGQNSRIKLFDNANKQLLNYRGLAYSRGEDASHVYFVIDGRVREVDPGFKRGDILIVNIIQNNGWLGINELVHDSSTYYTSVEPMKRTEVLGIPSQVFREVYRDSDFIEQIYVQGLLRQNLHLEFLLGISRLSPNERLTQFLKRAVSEYAFKREGDSHKLYLDWTHYEIGDAIGTVRSVVSREMRKLSKRNLVGRLEDKKQRVFWINPKILDE